MSKHKDFLEYVRGVFPKDTAVTEEYPMADLIEIYSDLYDEFKAGNSTEFAKLFYSNDCGICEFEFKPAKFLWNHQQRKIDEVTKQRDSFIKAHHIATNDICELQAKIDDAIKALERSKPNMMCLSDAMLALSILKDEELLK